MKTRIRRVVLFSLEAVALAVRDIQERGLLTLAVTGSAQERLPAGHAVLTRSYTPATPRAADTDHERLTAATPQAGLEQFPKTGSGPLPAEPLNSVTARQQQHRTDRAGCAGGCASIAGMADQPEADAIRTGQPPGLQIAPTAVDGIKVVALTGVIDADTVAPLEEVLDVTGLSPPRIVIDLRHVTFMDSTGLNLLIHTYRSVTGQAGWLRVIAPSDPVMRLLRITGVDTLIDIRANPRHALTG
jgi:stage II sporulation protein AA (anti-sigma F factor antagonist)